MRRRLLISALLIALPVTLMAQAGPAFDVISIKPNRTNQGIPVVAFQPGGRMIAGNVVIRQVIQVAYGLEDVQLVNAPDWTATERFGNASAFNCRTRSSQTSCRSSRPCGCFEVSIHRGRRLRM